MGLNPPWVRIPPLPFLRGDENLGSSRAQRDRRSQSHPFRQPAEGGVETSRWDEERSSSRRQIAAGDQSHPFRFLVGMRTSVRAERSEPEVIRPEMAGGKQAKPAGDRSPQAINPTPSASPPKAELKHPGGMRAPRSGTDRPKVGPAGVKAGGRNQHSAVRAGDRSPQAINPTPSVPARCSGQQEGCRGPIDSSAGTPTLQLNV